MTGQHKSCFCYLGIEFANKDDQRYYLEGDPVHRKFSSSVRPLAVKFMVIDYTPGVFKRFRNAT